MTFDVILGVGSKGVIPDRFSWKEMGQVDIYVFLSRSLDVYINLFSLSWLMSSSRNAFRKEKGILDLCIVDANVCLESDMLYSIEMVYNFSKWSISFSERSTGFREIAGEWEKLRPACL